MALKYRKFSGKICSFMKNGRQYLRGAYRCPSSGKAKQVWRVIHEDETEDDVRLEIRKIIEKALNPPPAGEWIYLVRMKGTQFYKIGITCNLQRRIIALQNANPFELELLVKIPGNTALEYALHKRMAHNWVRGEWFSFDSPEEAIDIVETFKYTRIRRDFKENELLDG
jgi:hypothetical protein